MILVVMIVLLVVGSLAFHFLSPWYLTPLASNWDMIDLTLDITFLGVWYRICRDQLVYGLLRMEVSI